MTGHDYLGVTTNSKLSWKPHINKVQNKTSRTLGLIKRTLHATSRPVRKTAYKALVRPTLEFEYATCAWSPYTNVDTQKVERVQRAAARFVVGDYQRRSSVTTMLSRLQWDSLEIRRRLRDASIFYKIFNGLVNIPLPPVIVAADNSTIKMPTRTQAACNSLILPTVPELLLCEVYPHMEQLATTSCPCRHGDRVPVGRPPSHQDNVDSRPSDFNLHSTYFYLTLLYRTPTLDDVTQLQNSKLLLISRNYLKT